VEAASNAYLALDRPDAALRTCERLLQSPAVPALAHYCRARALSALERNAEAVASLERAFAVEGAFARLPDPSEDDWFILLGDDPKFEALVKRRAAQIAAAEKK
jgi:tetratricopeptide (TPR) repeat protein